MHRVLLIGKRASVLTSPQSALRKVGIEVDRDNDRYFETVIDPATGEVLRDCDEPLSAHRDRGSAKKPRSKPK